MRVTPKPLIVVLLAAAMMVVGVVYTRRGISRPNQVQQQGGPDLKHAAATAGYAHPDACASCHAEIARTYRLTGMARTFAKLRPGAWPADAFGAGGLADFTIRNRLHHAASDRHYTMLERGGQFYQRRHEVGFDGQEANVVELEAGYVIGSGNHAQTFLHRNADGRVREMPVTWYAERGGYWAMSPGYDRRAHLDFRRLIVEDCMSCHNGYPRAAMQDDGNGPRFAEPLPEGIDCQRCHGPGQQHIDAIKAGRLQAGLQAIVNPATFDRQRQLETCLQCHLETTSSPLPFQIRRYEHPPFSFTPGKALSDYFMYFDHAPGTGRDDKFGIASAPYRLGQSACFQRSEMTCVTCHKPHDSPRGATAVQHYVSVCQSCHQDVHRSGTPRVQNAGARATCLDCHMPKRRGEDAVHVVVTDHYIQRRRAAVDLLAPRKEADNFEHGDYRGEVVAYYPPKPPATPENELYLALAQVLEGSNLAAGIPRLQQAIERHRPARADFYFELARAYSKTSDYEAAIRWCEETLRRDAAFAPALKELAAAATTLGRLAQAAQALEKAVTLHPKDGDALADLGNVYLQQDRIDEAQGRLRQALTLDPDLPRANNTMALTALKKGETDVAETHFRAAIRHQPDLSEAQNNLGNLLASRKAYAEAGHHFEKAILANPNYVEARHSYGVVLALTGAYPRAVTQLRAAVRLAPRLAQARIDLADALAAMGRIDEAAREYGSVADQSTDPIIRKSALDALRALRR